MNKRQINKLKDSYEKEKIEIIRSLSLIDNELDLEGDEIDVIQGMTIHDLSEKLSLNKKIKLNKINDALKAIEDGTINECEDCGEIIGEKRLLAIPGVRLCIRCAEMQETNSKMFF